MFCYGKHFLIQFKATSSNKHAKKVRQFFSARSTVISGDTSKCPEISEKSILTKKKKFIVTSFKSAFWICVIILGYPNALAF